MAKQDSDRGNRRDGQAGGGVGDDTSEKLLPQNVEAEAATLGSLLIDPDAMALVAGYLRPSDFYRDSHRVIYAAARDLYESGAPADLVTLVDELGRRGQVDAAGGVSYVSSLANQVPTAANIERYAGVVTRTATLRRLIHAAGQIAGIAYNEPDAEVAIEQARGLIQRVAAASATQEDAHSYGELLDEMFEDVLGRMEHPERGIKTGIAALDTQVGSLETGDLVYLCGRPGSGKSALGLELATRIARRFTAQANLNGDGIGDTPYAVAADNPVQPSTVDVVTLEMKALQQVRRIVAALSGVNTRAMRAGFRRPDGVVDVGLYHQMKAAAVADRASLARSLYIADQPMTLARARAHVLSAATHRRLKVVVIDQLDLFSDDAGDSRQRRGEYERITTFSRTLKQLAREAGVVIICLTQLNREVEKRENKRPQLADLRSSGQLEQDADMVWGLYRPAYYDVARRQTDSRFAEFAELTLLKQRDSETNIVIPLRYEPPFTRFGPWPEAWDWPTDASSPDGRDAGGTRAARDAKEA